ncbi:MAG: hypothetical protein KDK97_24325, partial [Verrucomicrobiales bacterium]|nr:hypothetical protein [Verrucomicrobiales bacterium]
AEQKADGTWAAAGQFSGMQKRGGADAVANAVRLNLLALATPKEAQHEMEAAHAKSASVLQRKDNPVAIESLVFRLLYAREVGKVEEVAMLRREILKHQRGDGGWSSIIGANRSDPLATGQVLYVLQQGAEAGSGDAIARAQHWLLKTQLEDGGWQSDITHISKVDRSSPEKAKSLRAATEIYHYWGSSWATLGLLMGVPVR